MKVRIQTNFNFKTGETCFGISIKPDGGNRYCKYPIGFQQYKTIGEAKQAKDNVQKYLDAGGNIYYSPNGSNGINRHEYVKILLR